MAGGNWGQTPITLYPQHARQAGALAAAQSVVTSAIAEQAMAMGITGQKVGDLIHAARVAAVAAWGGMANRARLHDGFDDCNRFRAHCKWRLAAAREECQTIDWLRLGAGIWLKFANCPNRSRPDSHDLWDQPFIPVAQDAKAVTQITASIS